METNDNPEVPPIERDALTDICHGPLNGVMERLRIEAGVRSFVCILITKEGALSTLSNGIERSNEGLLLFLRSVVDGIERSMVNKDWQATTTTKLYGAPYGSTTEGKGPPE